jgi:hypothetical protein
VTAAFLDSFYIGSDDGAGGIRVDSPGHAVSLGMRAGIKGLLSTSGDGERFLAASYAARDGDGVVRPAFRTVASLGGADWGWGVGDPAGQLGVELGLGLNNIGMLVRLCGRVQSVRDDYFYLDDSDGASPYALAKVLCPAGVPVPPVGVVVGVTGISSMEFHAGVHRRVLRARFVEDVTVFAQ